MQVRALCLHGATHFVKLWNKWKIENGYSCFLYVVIYSENVHVSILIHSLPVPQPLTCAGLFDPPTPISKTSCPLNRLDT